MPVPDVSFSDVVSYVKDITMSGALVFVLWGGKQKWWVWGWQYEEELKRTYKAEQAGEYWQRFSYSMLTANEQIVKRLPTPPSTDSRREEP